MAEIPCPLVALTVQDLLDLLQNRLLPDHYVDPLKNPGPGIEVLQAIAQAFARASQAVEHLGCDSQISTSSSGAKATGNVELFRDSPNNAFDNQVTGQQGVSASIVAGAAVGQMRVSGLVNMAATSVGRFLLITDADSLANNGTFLIAGFVNSTTVDVFNAAAVIPDGNNGFIVWHEVTRDVIVKKGTRLTTSKGGRDFLTTQDVTFIAQATAAGAPVQSQVGIAASIVAGAPGGQMRVTGLTGMVADSVGRFLVITKAGKLGNIGRFRIVTLNSATSVDVVNAAAVIPDTNNGALNWREESSSTPVEAENIGYEWNVTGQVIAADGTVLVGEIDTVEVLVEDPPIGDPTVKVRQITATTGGRDASLDALGKDRGIIRSDGEADTKYRARVRALPDTITPDAIRRSIESALAPFKAEFVIIETFEITYQTCYDGPPNSIPSSLYNPNLFCYDDPDLDATPFRNRWMDEHDYRGGLIVVVENVQPISDVGMAYDDSALNASALVSTKTGGKRAVCAYDVPSSLDFGYLQGGYDGFDLQKQALYKGLLETLQSIKAGGVSVAVELKGQ